MQIGGFSTFLTPGLGITTFLSWEYIVLGVLAQFRLICQTVLIFLNKFISQTELKQNWSELYNMRQIF